MKLQCEANQEFQLDAIQAAVGLFNGQPAGVSGFYYAIAWINAEYPTMQARLSDAQHIFRTYMDVVKNGS